MFITALHNPICPLCIDASPCNAESVCVAACCRCVNMCGQPQSAAVVLPCCSTRYDFMPSFALSVTNSRKTGVAVCCFTNTKISRLMSCVTGSGIKETNLGSPTCIPGASTRLDRERKAGLFLKHRSQTVSQLATQHVPTMMTHLRRSTMLRRSLMCASLCLVLDPPSRECGARSKGRITAGAGLLKCCWQRCTVPFVMFPLTLHGPCVMTSFRPSTATIGHCCSKTITLAPLSLDLDLVGVFKLVRHNFIWPGTAPLWLVR